MQKREQDRLEKLRQMEHTDALAALEHFTQYQKSKEENLAQRMDQVHDNRERKLREAKEKQERRKKHAEEVRRRKALARENGLCEPTGTDEYPTPRPEPAEVTSTPEGAERLKSPLQVQEAKVEGSESSSSSGQRDADAASAPSRE